jgi:hypothetical protein
MRTTYIRLTLEQIDRIICWLDERENDFVGLPEFQREVTEISDIFRAAEKERKSEE